MSDRLFDVLREPLQEYAPDERDYADIFDRFEVHLSVAHGSTGGWFPLGRFARQGRRGVLERINNEVEEEKELWLPLIAGMYGGSLSAFLKDKQELDARVAKTHWW